MPIVVPSSAAGGLFEGLTLSSRVHEDTWTALLDGFARDRGVVPPALVQKMPQRVRNRICRLTDQEFMTPLKALTGKRQAGAAQAIIRKLPYLFEFESLGINDTGETEQINVDYMMPIIDFGARICGDFTSRILCMRMCHLRDGGSHFEMEFAHEMHEAHVEDEWSSVTSVQNLFLQGVSVSHGSRTVAELDAYLNQFVCGPFHGDRVVSTFVVCKIEFESVGGECSGPGTWCWDRLRVNGKDNEFEFTVVIGPVKEE